MSNQSAAVVTLSDIQVIHQVLSGEKELYEVLVRRYNQRLYRAGMSILNNDSEVEDAMQEAYIKAYENLGKFEHRSAFSTWLTRIMINESLLRVKKRKQKTEIKEENMETVEQSPLSNMIHAELKVTLEKAILDLPEKYRVVFVLREIEDLSVMETQACLDLSESNVKTRLNRAKSMLRDSLSDFVNKESLIGFHLTRCDRLTSAVMARIL